MSANRCRYTEHRPLRSSFPRLAPSSGNDGEMREKARDLWRLFGIVVLWPDQPVAWEERGIIEAAARKLYGPKAR